MTAPEAPNFEREATPDDAKGLFDAIAVRLMLDDAMPSQPKGGSMPPEMSGLDLVMDEAALVELIPPSGLARLAVRMRADILEHASVIREVPTPEIAPDTYRSETYRLSVGEDGKPRISQSVETCQEADQKADDEEEFTLLSDILEVSELDRATGGGLVSSATCQELITQISQTRVNPIS